MTTHEDTPFFPNALDVLCREAPAARLSFWWLRCDDWNPPLRFVYGCVLPTRPRESERWARRNVAERSFPVAGGVSKKRKLIRKSLEAAPAKIKLILDTLQQGNSLSNACRRADVPAIDEEFDGTIMDAKWQRLPTVFLSGMPSQSFLSPPLHGRTSLTNDAGCLCARLCPSSRLSFLEGELLPDQVLRWVASELRVETGIEFNSTAGDAFGSLEVFAFPSLDERERPRLKVKHSRVEGEPTSRLDLQLSGLEPSSEYFAQVRSEQVKSVASDQLVSFDSSGRVSVVLPDPVDGILVRVWRKQGAKPWLLWDELEQHYIRTIAMSGHLMALRGEVGASWLQGLPGRLGSRAEAFARIAQVAMNTPAEVSNRQSWEQDIVASRAAVRRAHPSKSEGRFFDRGWGTNENKLEFAEWLKETLSKASGTIILVDPYFDILGLDLICRSSGAAKEFVVLTNTQVQSADDEIGTSRSTRLTRAGEDYFTVLRGLNLKVCDLRSTDGGNKQLFHDRYLLFYNDQRSIEKGFHLSTSLQSAATTSPILITPIPADVLDSVVDYVEGLMTPKTPSTVLETLFPPESLRRPVRRERVSEQTTKSVLHFLEVAQGGNGLGQLDSRERLKELGVYDGEKVRVDISDEHLVRVHEFLTSHSVKEAGEVWDGLVQASLAGSFGGIPEPLERLCERRDPQLGTFLKSYVIAHATGVLRAERALEHTRTLATVLDLDFSRAVHEAARFYEHHHEFPLGTSWPIHLGLACLIRFHTQLLDGVIHVLKEERTAAKVTFARQRLAKQDWPSSEQLRNASLVLGAVDAALSAVVATVTQFAQGHWLSLPDAVLDSTIPFIRSLPAVASWRKARANMAVFPSFVAQLEHYSEQERQEVLGLAVYECRVDAHRAVGQGMDQSVGLPEDLVKAVLSSFTKSTSSQRMVELVSFFSGPSLGNWSESTHNQLLKSLTESGVLTNEQLFEIWNEVLEKRMVDQHVDWGDAELVQVWGACFHYANPSIREQVLGSVNKELGRAAATLREPLLQSRNYSRWEEAQRNVLWCLVRLWAIQRIGSEEPGLAGKLSGLVGKARTFVEEERLVDSAVGVLQELAQGVLADLRKAEGA